MLGFTKKEAAFVFLVLLSLVSATLVNLSASYRKSRDNDRKNSLGDIVARIGEFKKTVGYFPESLNGNIVGCDGFRDKEANWHFKECNWGENKVNSYYFDPLPVDPYSKDGRRFVYVSNGTTFQLYVALEGKYEDEFDEQIVELKISCGDTVCNAGRTNGNKETLYTPLSKK